MLCFFKTQLHIRLDKEARKRLSIIGTYTIKKMPRVKSLILPGVTYKVFAILLVMPSVSNSAYETLRTCHESSQADFFM